MDQTAPAVPEEQRFILSALSPSLAQRRLALAVMIALILACLITVGPLSTFQPRRIDAFVPIHATAVFVTDFITAVLLFAQCSIFAVAWPRCVREWISLRGADLDPVDADLSGRVCARWPAWRWAVFRAVALQPAAPRLSDVRHRLCPFEGRRSDEGAMAGFPGCRHSSKCGSNHRADMCSDSSCHSGAYTIAPHHARPRPSFYPPALACRVSSRVERCRGHCAVGAAAFRSRLVADGGDGRLRYRGLCGRFSRSGPLQHRVVRRPGLQPNLWQSPALCSAVRDHGALWATAARNPRPTARARGAADDRRCGIGLDGSRDQATIVGDDYERQCQPALA